MRCIKLWSAVLFMAMLIFSIAFPAGAQKLQQQLVRESMIERAVKRGTLIVGMSTFVPWAMKDKTGKLVGFEIDVARQLAKDMGVKVEFVPTRWAGIIPSLLTGKFDIIIGGMSVRPDRNLKVNFSIPYDYAGQALVASKKLASGFTHLKDFNRPDVVIAARLGSTAAAAAKKFMPRAKNLVFDDESQVIQEVLNARAHAAVASAPLPAFQALKYPDRLFIPIRGTFTKEPIAFAVRKGDFDSLNFLNNWIRFTRAGGWLAERKHYWFETKDWEAMVK